MEIDAAELLAVVERTRLGALGDDDRAVLEAAVGTLTTLTKELEASDVTIGRLRRLLFGSSSEKTRDVVGSLDTTGEDRSSPEDPDGSADEEETEADGSDAPPASDDEDETSDRNHTSPSSEEPEGSDDDKKKKKKKKKKPKGHGRLGVDAYPRADRVCIDHATLRHGDRCPGCGAGKVYNKAPAVMLRIRGVSPLQATVYELERLRCNLCGKTFTAAAPEGLGDAKYDETAVALLALLRYGFGMPLNRLERLGKQLGIPVPSSTQWDVVNRGAIPLEPVWRELVRQGANGDIVYIDDTHARVLGLDRLIRDQLALDPKARTGIQTTGVLSTVGTLCIALFFTGRDHAGENLAKVLEQRTESRVPIQMSDALSRNTSHAFQTLVAHCLAHARRYYVDLHDHFPAEVTHVLTELGKVYTVDAEAREQQMDAEARLRHHQTHSGPVMEALAVWLQAQFDEERVEPNSSLGRAIRYMQKHWSKLTLFLRVAGAPLTNNLCERALKRIILHRKNSLFYKTERGAEVGDQYMSVIYTAERCGADPFDYLVAIQRHAADVARQPHRWMPWNYTDMLTDEPR